MKHSTKYLCVVLSVGMEAPDSLGNPSKINGKWPAGGANDPSLACYRWITGIDSAAYEVSNDTRCISLKISGSYAALSIPVIQR